MPTEIALLKELVAIPSVSGNERPVAEYLERYVQAAGVPVVRDDASVTIRIESGRPGPVLAFVSHLDVVPPGEGWTRDPFVPVVEGDRLYGRGASDAKASVAAMTLAALDAAPRVRAGTLLCLFGYGEETRNTSMPVAVERAGRIDAAVVGEPTNLAAAVAQRGLMMADLVATGDQRHAGYAADDGVFTNALVSLARDLVRLDGIVAERVHSILGVATVTPTMVEAGVSRNVTPPSAKAILDIRSTPAWPHAELAAALKERLGSQVIITSDRLVPCETPASSRLLPAARRVRPGLATFGSPTCSDWVFLRSSDAFKCGPGTSRRSHTADESVDLPEVTDARALLYRPCPGVPAMSPRRARPRTLWTAPDDLDPRVLALTVGDDRYWDSHLLRFDVLGSLGHVEGLRASGLLTAREHGALRNGLRRALRAVEQGRLVIGPDQEDAHSAVEAWLTRRLGSTGERLHTGRSRNDQIACDLRLLLKDRLSMIGYGALAATAALLEFAHRHERVLWPGYTHTRRAMPSSAGLWAGALAEGMLDTLEALPALWRQVDRSPLGSAAGYGVPLPLRREVAARALGFRAVENNVAVVQNGRGKLEAAALFWSLQLGHEVSRCAADVILFSAEEYGWLVLPASLATGSSIMPHKRNPDLLELARARVAALEGDLAGVLALRARLTSGYHRDFQLLKEPLIRGLGRIIEGLAICGLVIPRLEVDPARGVAALEGGALATDQVMRLVESGTPFRRAYREVGAAFRRGESMPAVAASRIISRRRSAGGLGNPGFARAWRRWRAVERWLTGERHRFDRALARLAGPAPRRRA